MPKKSIAVVDDSEFMRLALTGILEPTYNVFAVERLTQANAQHEIYGIDAVIVDVELANGRTGTEAIEYREKFHKFDDIPIIFISANPEHRTLVEQQGYYFFTKDDVRGLKNFLEYLFKQ